MQRAPASRRREYLGGDSDSNGPRRPHIRDPMIEGDILTEVVDPLTEEDTLVEDPLMEEDPLEEDILMEMGDTLEEEDTMMEDPGWRWRTP